MRFRRTIPIFLSALVLFTGCNQSKAPVEQARVQPAESTQSISPMSQVLRRRFAQGARSADSMSIRQSNEELRATTAICPDRRFLDAVATIHHLATGSEADAVDAQYERHAWKISYKNADVGVLDELPDFEKMYALLIAWARRVSTVQSASGKKYSEIEELLEKNSPEDLFAALGKIDAVTKSGSKDPTLMKLSARASVLLAWQSFDSLEISDQIFSNALGQLAYFEAVAKQNLPEERVLIADALGYRKAARQLSLKLPAENPVCLYLNDQADKWSPGTFDINSLKGLLYLRSVCLKREKVRWREWMDRVAFDRSGNLPALKFTSEMGFEEMMMPVALQVMGYTRLSALPQGNFKMNTDDLVWSDPASKLSNVASLLAPNALSDFEKSLTEHFSSMNVSSDVAELKRAFYRAYFFSAIDIIARTTLALPSAETFSERLAACLEYEGDGPSSQLGSWVVAMSSPHGNVDGQIESALLNLTKLGPSAMVALLPQAKTNLPSSNKWSVIRELFFVRIDSRPEIRLPLADVIELPFLDLTAHKAVVSAALRDGSGDTVQASLFLNKMIGNTAGVVKAFEAHSTSIREKLDLISYLSFLSKGNSAKLQEMYTRLLKESSGSWEVERAYVEYLAKSDKRKAIVEIRQWMAKNASTSKSKQSKASKDADEKLLPRLVLAQLLYDENDFPAVKAELKAMPVKNSLEYLKLMALSELAAGNLGSAKSWAEELRRSYPKSLEGLLVELEICLTQKQFVPAAYVLRPAAHVSRVLWKEQIGALVIAKVPDVRDIGAFVGALKSAQIDADDNLGQIAAAAYSADKADLAFQILSVVNVNTDSLYDLRTCQYRYLKRALGKDKAIAWLKKQIPEDNRAAVAPYAFFAGQDELLFDFAPIEDSLDGGEQIWILRAASSVLKPLPNYWKTQLNAHFDGRKDVPGKIGLYLLGKCKPYELENIPLPADSRCRTAFYLAWKQMAEPGNFVGETALLLACVSTNQMGLDEYQWSNVWLRDIANSLSGQPLIYSNEKLQRLRVVAPQQDGDWSQQRRFKLSAR
jgi:hypothetical protein